MRNKANKHLGIEIDPELHYKLHYISKTINKLYPISVYTVKETRAIYSAKSPAPIFSYQSSEVSSFT